MLFNSLQFFVFFVCIFSAYWIVHKNIKLRNILLLVGSYYFYGSWDWRFLSLIIISTLTDYYCGKKIHESTSNFQRKLFLVISISVNIGILATFKYFGFFVNSFVDLINFLGFQANYSTLHIILPVGISFYTFQTLTYSIDIYRKQIKPTRSLLNFSAFVAFFPQLVAGPIERAKTLLPQIENKVVFDINMARDGLFLVLLGLVKKVLVADRLAVYVDTVFADPSNFTGPQCAVAVVFFSVQIYCDFSGYSDIARGIAKLLGIDLMINFKAPYLASSLQEFWHRWHISLSTWFRDYVYIPLGGSKKNIWVQKRNLLITFVVSGLWHGANYTFIVWGLIHACSYIVDPFPRLLEGAKGLKRVVVYSSGLVFTLLVVNIGWVFFRANNIHDAWLMLQKILTAPFSYIPDLANQSGIAVSMSNTEFTLSLYFIVVIFILDVLIVNKGTDRFIKQISYPYRWALSWFMLVNLLLLAPSDTGSFIYFQF